MKEGLTMKKILCVLLLLILPACGLADEYFIICQPSSYVNVRISPKKDAAVIGRYELGQKVTSDGKRQNGFLHLTNLSLENCEGWVSTGFVTGEMVIETRTARISRDKVACRRSIKGNRRKWLQKGDIVTVFAWSDDWAVTNQGFIMTKFLEGQQ
jgi:uncharacterized protein YgiM (DUF1202 family)